MFSYWYSWEKCCDVGYRADDKLWLAEERRKADVVHVEVSLPVTPAPSTKCLVAGHCRCRAGFVCQSYKKKGLPRDSTLGKPNARAEKIRYYRFVESVVKPGLYNRRSRTSDSREKSRDPKNPNFVSTPKLVA